MQTKAKSNSVITHAPQEDGSILFNVKGAGEFRFDPAKTSEANQRRAMLHGFVQRIADAAAMSRNTTTGQAASPADKMAAMQRLVSHYESGSTDWSPARAEGKAGGLDQVILAAVVEATGKTTEEVRAMVAKGAEGKGITPKAYLAALGTAKLVAPIVARIRGEQAGEDGDDLLESMVSGE